MHQIYPDDGLLEFLDRAIVGGFLYHLFTNDITPSRGTIIDDFDEADYSGYAAVGVAAAAFTLEGIAAHIGSKIAAPISFTNTSGGDYAVYGYYVTNADDDTLLMAARFDDAPVTQEAGESWVIIPTISDYSQFNS